MASKKRSSKWRHRTAPQLPKLCGGDIEVANFITRPHQSHGSDTTAKEASRILLEEFEGFSSVDKTHPSSCSCSSCRPPLNADDLDTPGAFARLSDNFSAGTYYVHADGQLTYSASGSAEVTGSAFNPQDHGRTYLSENGGCVYIDLDHIELCLPEVRSAHDHVACWHAMLRLLRRALDAANSKRPNGERVHVLINNSDGQGHSYGSHLNFLVTERCRRNIFERKMHYLLNLAAYQVSSIIFTGQGKVGGENRMPDISFQISQRADFFEQLTGSQTTFARPIINGRDESLCGTSDYLRHSDGGIESQMARLHVIFYDSTLCHVSSLLKVGVMQIILAMIEAEKLSPHLMLEDPVLALKVWSHDPSLTAKARMCSGRALRAVELQSLFLDEAMRFVERGGCDGIVPRAADIVELWADTLVKLRERDFPALTRRLDWVLKKSIIEGVMDAHPDLDWKHPTVKRLDLVYSSLDPGDGLFWAYEADGLVDSVVSDADIRRFLDEPPEDTRAWTRAMLLRRAGRDQVAAVDWDFIRFRPHEDRLLASERTFDLANPLHFTRELSESLFDSEESLDALLDALERSGRVEH